MSKSVSRVLSWMIIYLWLIVTNKFMRPTIGTAAGHCLFCP